MNLLVYLLACAGATSIIVTSTLFAGIRRSAWPNWFSELLHCPQCCGWWVGAIFWILCRNSLPHVGFGFNFILYACAASIVSYIVIEAIGDDGWRFERRNT